MAHPYFGPQGPLAQRLGVAYHEREQQQLLVDTIIGLEVNDRVLIHGPVAIGKNDALGAAALISGRPTVLSTYTRTLLDSLEKASESWALDFPEKRIIVMRGRSNYVCAAKLAGMREALPHQTTTTKKKHLRVIEYGETHRLVADPDAPEGARALSQSSCPGQSKCDYSHKCHYYNERAASKRADLVICTHAMVRAMCAYPTVTKQGLEYWFPTRGQWLADEGDRLLDACSEDNELTGRTLAAMATDPHLSPESRAAVDHLVDTAHSICAGKPYGETLDPRNWKDWPARTQALLQRDLADYPPQGFDADLSASLAGVERMIRMLGAMQSDVPQAGFAVSVRAPKRSVDAQEKRYLATTFRWRPISIGNAIDNQVRVFHRFAAVSGSLALPMAGFTPGVAGANPHVTRELGFGFSAFVMRVAPTKQLVLRSEIDYEKNLRVVDASMPRGFGRDVERETFTSLAVRLHREAGNTIALCTSYASVNAVRAAFRDAGLASELLAQQEDSPETVETLAAQLRAGKRASIVATTSGWVGLDLDSRHKSAVLIERVPVASPAQDLCLQGRIMRDGSRLAYSWYGTPTALKLATQGVGRTLRRETDRCLLVLCDGRFFNEYSAAIPGGQRVSLDAGIRWITTELGAPPTLPEAPQLAADNWADILEMGT